ncbi:hypothetical protein OPV22_028077 [Ensete ventricosum]|uniref:Uncharacterized protein n=1 Tax=Ensete ventricosum TaxID=4639 RepID=A0AAV8PTP4_ENSVE|nr:hypothetical protein OPV22_028077 [Ensete ventricosum]RWW22765.1 hypothetical protein GW17_00013022 [Ensete ventricosum]
MSADRKDQAGASEGEADGGDERPVRPRYERWLSGLELAMEAGPLKDLDPEKLRNEIRRWAKAVVAYARQLSFGAVDRSES